MPGDDGWPTTYQWNQLNTTVQGRLIATNPISHVCHNPTYDEQACNALRAAWGPTHVQYVLAGTTTGTLLISRQDCGTR
jgi:hypothetical protein